MATERGGRELNRGIQRGGEGTGSGGRGVRENEGVVEEEEEGKKSNLF